MVDYKRAVKRPFEDLGTLGIGIAVQLIPIVNLMALGFYLNCAKTAINKDFELPEWEDGIKLFTSALATVIICLTYMLPVTILTIATFGATLFSLISDFQTGLDGLADISLGSIGIGSILLLFLLLILLTYYILPAAILYYVKDDKFASAFKIKTILKKSFTLNYFINWIMMTAYVIILTIVLSIIPVIGTSAGAFIGLVTASTVLGEICTS